MVPKEHFSNKLSAEMLSSCWNRIDEKTVKGIFNNLTVVDLDWHESYEVLVTIEYTKFKPLGGSVNLDFTHEQTILFNKLDKAREEFTLLSRERQQNAAKTMSILGFNLSEISGEVKTFYLLGVFAVFIFGIIYFLSKLDRAAEKSKKKKKNQ